MAKYQGAGEVFAADFHAIKFVGKTKSGKALTIEMPKAVNLGNIEWAFAEKGDTVATVVFSGVYSNTDAMVTTRTEPWTIEIDGTQTSGAAEIITGAGLVYIDNQQVALTRGGSTFAVNRTFREINADGDMGPVENRIALDESRPVLTLNALTFLTSIPSMYSAMSVVSTS